MGKIYGALAKPSATISKLDRNRAWFRADIPEHISDFTQATKKGHKRKAVTWCLWWSIGGSNP